MEYLTIEELCQILKVPVPDRTTVWRWRKEGMPFVKVGREIRYEKEKVLKWLEEKGKKE